jgi:preprotein translocase subunit SecA
MFLNLATQIFGSSNGRKLKSLGKHIAPINALEPRFEAMSDAELQSQTSLFRQRLANGEALDSMLHEAFAVTREAAKRSLASAIMTSS